MKSLRTVNEIDPKRDSLAKARASGQPARIAERLTVSIVQGDLLTSVFPLLQRVRSTDRPSASFAPDAPSSTFARPLRCKARPCDGTLERAPQCPASTVGLPSGALFEHVASPPTASPTVTVSWPLGLAPGRSLSRDGIASQLVSSNRLASPSLKPRRRIVRCAPRIGSTLPRFSANNSSTQFAGANFRLSVRSVLSRGRSLRLSGG
jgi:hypothetical protein